MNGQDHRRAIADGLREALAAAGLDASVAGRDDNRVVVVVDLDTAAHLGALLGQLGALDQIADTINEGYEDLETVDDVARLIAATGRDVSNWPGLQRRDAEEE